MWPQPSESTWPSSARPLAPFFGWEGSPTKIDYRKKAEEFLSLTSLLEGLVNEF